MMRFELGLEEPKPERARISALTIGGAYMVGGLIPLGSYMLISNAHNALLVSVAVTLAFLERPVDRLLEAGQIRLRHRNAPLPGC